MPYESKGFGQILDVLMNRGTLHIGKIPGLNPACEFVALHIPEKDCDAYYLLGQLYDTPSKYLLCDMIDYIRGDISRPDIEGFAFSNPKKRMEVPHGQGGTGGREEMPSVTDAEHAKGSDPVPEGARSAGDQPDPGNKDDDGQESGVNDPNRAGSDAPGGHPSGDGEGAGSGHRGTGDVGA